MKYLHITSVFIIALALFLFAGITLHLGENEITAQGPNPNEVTVTKTLNRSSNVVRVGEVLSFTIEVINNSNFTLTNVTLVDDYDNTTLAFARANPPQDQHTPPTIIWNNVAAPPIPPGQRIAVTVVFTTEHPKPAVVNHARAQDIIGDQGQLNITATSEISNEAIGGAAPVVKRASIPNTDAVVGYPVTYTHIISNDGAAIMTFLPLSDTYDAQFLEFNYAVPTPTLAFTAGSSGFLQWADLTVDFHDLAPFETITVTTVFTALTQVLTAVNQASTQGARDEYNNDLAGGSALVPIVIVDAATATPTPMPTATPYQEPTSPPLPDSDDEPEATPTPTATPIATATPTSTPIVPNQNFPSILPETGWSLSMPSWLLWSIAFLLIVSGMVLNKKNEE